MRRLLVALSIGLFIAPAAVHAQTSDARSGAPYLDGAGPAVEWTTQRPARAVGPAIFMADTTAVAPPCLDRGLCIGAVAGGAALGSTLGLVGGALVGGGLAELAGCSYATCLISFFAGVLIGPAVLGPVGAHLANGASGSLGRSLLHSSMISVAAAGGFLSTPDDELQVGIILSAAALHGVTATATELLTDRRR